MNYEKLSYDDSLEFHVRISNSLVDACMVNVQAVKDRNEIVKKSESRKMFLAGCLLMDSSSSLIKKALGTLRLSKKLLHREFEDVISSVISAAPTVIGALNAIISRYKHHPELFNKNVFLNGLGKVNVILDDLYGLSESIMFKKDGKEFFALQDKNLNRWSKDIIDILNSNMALIKSMQKHKNPSIRDVGIKLEKSLSRLDGHLKRVKAVDHLMSQSEVIGRVANSSSDIVQILPA